MKDLSYVGAVQELVLARMYLDQYDRILTSPGADPAEVRKVCAKLQAVRRAMFDDEQSGDVLVALLEIARECARAIKRVPQRKRSSPFGRESTPLHEAVEDAIYGTDREEPELLERIAGNADVKRLIAHAAFRLRRDPATKRVPKEVAHLLADAARVLHAFGGSAATSPVNKLNTGRARVPRTR